MWKNVINSVVKYCSYKRYIQIYFHDAYFSNFNKCALLCRANIWIEATYTHSTTIMELSFAPTLLFLLWNCKQGEWKRCSMENRNALYRYHTFPFFLRIYIHEYYTVSFISVCYIHLKNKFSLRFSSFHSSFSPLNGFSWIL